VYDTKRVLTDSTNMMATSADTGILIRHITPPDSLGMAQKYIAAIDQGTTSTRCIIFNSAGQPVASAQREHNQIFPRPAWVEHDATEIWESVKHCVDTALLNANLRPNDIASVGITNQRETVVVWDPVSGRPLYNALVWQDQRGAPLCTAIASRNGGPDCFKHKTGLPVVPYFSATKLAWLLDNVAGLRAAAENGQAIAGTIDSYLAWKLTGQHVTGTSTIPSSVFGEQSSVLHSHFALSVSSALSPH
jgi:glycerol kinase